jgi:hypothetical protein
MPSPAPANLKCGGGPRNPMERRWWLWGLARELGRLRADLVHGPDFAVPYLLRRPSVLTLHDLSPWMDERWHHAAHRVRRRTPVLFELGLATMVITPGEKVRRAIDAPLSQRVNLARPLPVVIYYATAIVRPGRAVEFYEDIYGHDARLERELARGYPFAR